MKRPASASAAVSRKKATSVVRRRPAAAKKLARVVRRRPAALKTPAQPCKSIADMTRKDFAFFEVRYNRGSSSYVLRGCKSNRKGYIFENLEINRFAETETKIPANARRKAIPQEKWLSEFFWDPAKRRLVPDAANLPVRASGKAYCIEGPDNWREHSMPFVVYVRDDAVSVFRRPRDGYVWEEDMTKNPREFDTDRLTYTDEVMTLNSPVGALIGIDEKLLVADVYGIGILVHVSATKGKCLTAKIQLDEARQFIQVGCTDLAGSQVLSVEVPVGGQVSLLAKKVADLLQALCVKCVDDNGKEISHDQPLKEYTQLTLQDATQSYVYIGEKIYSFDCVEAVTSYYSIDGLGNDVALTPTKVIFMMDQFEAPREQIAPHIVNDNWGYAYDAINAGVKFRKTPLVNVKDLTPRDI